MPAGALAKEGGPALPLKSIREWMASASGAAPERSRAGGVMAIGGGPSLPGARGCGRGFECSKPSLTAAWFGERKRARLAWPERSGGNPSLSAIFRPSCAAPWFGAAANLM